MMLSRDHVDPIGRSHHRGGVSKKHSKVILSCIPCNGGRENMPFVICKLKKEGKL